MESLKTLIAEELETIVEENSANFTFFDAEAAADLVIQQIKSRAFELGARITDNQGSGISEAGARVIVNNVLES